MSIYKLKREDTPEQRKKQHDAQKKLRRMETGCSGVLTKWNENRNYGFIKPLDGGPDVFLHITGLSDSAKEPVVGEVFSYGIERDDRSGRPQAVDAYQIKSCQSGTLTEWDDEHGYGFITPDDKGPKVFLHLSGLVETARRPTVGETFTYMLEKDEKSRAKAAYACQSKKLSRLRLLPFHHEILRLAAGCWLLGLAIIVTSCVLCKTYYLGIVISFVINSFLTVAFYWEDKYLAQYQCWRIPENRLHIWELLCGWPGALFAQQRFMHKNKKGEYQRKFAYCIVFNLLFVLLFGFVGVRTFCWGILKNVWNYLKYVVEFWS